MAVVTPVISAGCALKQTDWVPLIVPAELIMFSIIVNDVVEEQPAGVVTFTETKIEFVNGAVGINSTEVSVEVAVTMSVKTPFSENS